MRTNRRPRRDPRFGRALRACALLVFPWPGVPAFAQVVPNAGSALRDVAPQPAPAAPAGPAVAPLPPAAKPAQPAPPADQAAFTLRSVSFVGNTVFSSTDLAALAAGYIGKAVTFADLERIRQRITDRYREAGYPLAQAVLPVQDVTAGAVEFSIVEGRLGQVRLTVSPESPIGADRLDPFLAELKTGQPIRQDELERTLMLMSDLPGIVVQSALEQGEEPGTTDLVVDVGPSRRFDLLLSADNYGIPSTGEQRIGATLRINSPLGIGDNLDLQVLDTTASGLVYGRAGYEMPLGGRGTRLGIAYGELHYRLGEPFSGLDSSGSAEVFEVGLTQPFIRSRTRNLVGRLGYQHKLLEDRIGAVGFSSEQSIDLGVLGLSYEGRDNLWHGGYNSAALTAYVGEVDLRSLQALALDQSPQGPKTNGSFTHINYQLSRLQAVMPRTSAYLAVAGQWADTNLVSAEKIALGGPYAVRAYPTSEGVVDEGYVATGELRFSVTNQVTVSGFYDAGWGHILADPLPAQGTNSVTLRGYGLGLYWSAPYGFALRGSAAWRDTGPSLTAPDRVPRVYLQLTKSF